MNNIKAMAIHIEAIPGVEEQTMNENERNVAKKKRSKYINFPIDSLGISKLENKIKCILLGKKNKVTCKGAQLELVDKVSEETEVEDLIHSE